jgi:hypothetical protein
MQCLDKQGFTVLDNCFANYHYTLPSLSSVFLMKHHYYRVMEGFQSVSRGVSSVLNGENPVVQTFKANGYHFNVMDCNAGTVLGKGPSVDAYFCARPKERFKSMFPYYRFMEVLGNLGLIAKEEEKESCGFMTIDTGFLLSRLRQQREEQVPQFYCIYAGTIHTARFLEFHKDREYFDQFEREIYPGAPRFKEETYPRIRRGADRELIRVLEMVHEHDPEALVILIEDQAPHRYGVFDYGWEGDVNARIRSWGVEPRLLGMDNVAVLCAIKWGFSPRYFTGEMVMSHVNLFRWIFAELAEDPFVLESLASNISLVPADGGNPDDRLYLVVREGKLLLEWGPFIPPHGGKPQTEMVACSGQ